ncbi:MAG: geranylgeranyl reductase family protein [Bacteroidota bacterium]|nr:geranylgeranyl reductase family protein [Bacteroidota bacterium]
MLEETIFDIAICGAGPAGATCALALKNAGLQVVMIDKATFPRDKICGDAVSSITKRVLRQIDPSYETELLQFESKASITQAKLYSPNFESLEISFAKIGHCIKRIDFDNWLFHLALRENKELKVISGIGIKDVVQDENFSISLEDGRCIKSKLMIACDGAHSVAAKKIAKIKVDRKHYSGAVRQYYEGVSGLSGNALEVYFLKDFLPGYFWIFPLPNNQANVGFGMLSDTIAKNKIDLKKSLQHIIKDIPQVAERFKNATPLEDIKGFGLPLGSKKYKIAGKQYMLCGDAAALIDPFSGEGIETAMESGKFAAEQAIKCFQEKDFSEAFMMAYEQRVYNKMWPNFRNHYWLQKLLGDRKWLINGLISFGNIPFVKKQIPKVFY